MRSKIVVSTVVLLLSTFLASFAAAGDLRFAERVTLARIKASAQTGSQLLDLDLGSVVRLRDLDAVIVERFPLPGRAEADLELEAFDPVAPGARFVVVDEQGERDVPAPSLRFFRGTVRGELDSSVVLTVLDERIAGYVETGGRHFGFAPREFDRGREHSTEIEILDGATEEDPGRFCDGDHEPPYRVNSKAASSGPESAIYSDTPLQANVAVDATVEFKNRFGSVAATQSYILSLMAQVSALFQAEINVSIAVSYVRVFAADPDPYSATTDTNILLDEVQAEWNARQTAIPRTVVHLFSQRSSGGSGIAYLDVLCDHKQRPGRSWDYGVSVIPGGGATWEKRLVAHELGHNFASPHTHCYVPEIDQCANQEGCYAGPVMQTQGTIMSYCNQVVPVFGPRVTDVIRTAAEAAYPSCVSVVGLPGTVGVSGGHGAGLRLQRASASATQLTWDEPCNANAVPGQDYAIYSGSIGHFTSYSPLTCSTGGNRTYYVADAPGNRFYLVVPQTGNAEGSYGRTSSGIEREPANASCKPQVIGVCL